MRATADDSTGNATGYGAGSSVITAGQGSASSSTDASIGTDCCTSERLTENAHT
jgi:hypothetical protein